jgi:hypothetical protein
MTIGTRTRPCFLVLSATLLGACAAPRAYTFRPSFPSVADTHGHAAAVYSLPPERPEGEVRVLSSGIIDMQSAPGAGTFPVLHLRLLIANNGDQTAWTLDTRQVFVDIPGEGGAGVLYANADGGSMPLVAVGRGERRTVDLYFPVPGPVAHAGRLPAFDLRWQVQTGARMVAERTPFLRMEVDPPPPAHVHAALAVGWWPIWWVHPHYPRAHVFVHAPIVVVPRPAYRAYVVAPHHRRGERRR